MPTSLRHFAGEAPVLVPSARSAAPHPAGRTSLSSRRAASRCRFPCQRSRARDSSRSASTSSAKASAPSTITALGAGNMATVISCAAISRAPVAASSTIRFSARSLAGTIASASSRALVRARYSSPSISTTGGAFPADACSSRPAISATAQLPRGEEQPLELQPAVAVLAQRLDHLGAQLRLPEQRARRNALRQLARGAGQLAQVGSSASLGDEDVARPRLHRLGHLQGGIPLAVRLGEIERVSLVRGGQRLLHALEQLAPLALGLEGPSEAPLRSRRSLPSLLFPDSVAPEPGDQRLLRHRPELHARAAGADGGEQRVRIRAHQEEGGARRRFLQRLEERVLC